MNPALERVLDDSVVIVLGCGKIERENKRRAIQAARIAKGRKCKVVVSGNQEVKGKTEADYMGDVVEFYGVDRERIFVDSAAYNTATNLAYSKTLIEASNQKNIVLVTGLAHMSRAVRMARQMYPGYNVMAAPTQISNFADLCFEMLFLGVEMISSVTNSKKMTEYGEKHGNLEGFVGVRMIYNSREQ